MTYAEGLQLIQALASIATVLLVVLTWQQIRLVRKQATTTFEDSLTAQYRRIMEDIPTNIRLGVPLEHILLGRAQEVTSDRRLQDLIRFYSILNQLDHAQPVSQRENILSVCWE
jgi:hypothetical protein